jgi:hypothetical protein
MLCREMIAISCNVRTKLRRMLCGHDFEFLNVKTGGIFSNL